MSRITMLIGAAAIAAVASGAHADADIASGKAKAEACAGCHGANGEGVGSNPPLAGRSSEDFIKAMAEYKSGARKNAAMKMFSTKLTPQDVENLAAYYASLKK